MAERNEPSKLQTEIKQVAKKNFWLDTLGDDSYKKLKEMNTSDGTIMAWQKKRIQYSVLFVVIFAIVGFTINYPAMILLGLVVGIGWYFTRGNLIEGWYRTYKFNRALSFAKFTRLVVPYLRSDSVGGSESRVYSTLSDVVSRMDEPEDRQLLATLLYEMTQDPRAKEPYTNYAMKVGGTDFAITFMETLYDIRQGAANLDIVERLSKESNLQVQKLMDDIVDMKAQKLAMIATKATMPVMLIILGSIIAVAIHSFTGLDIKLPF